MTRNQSRYNLPMLQGDRRRRLVLIGLVWLAGLLLLAITCIVQRQRELSGVERELIASRYSAFGEIGRHARDAWPTYRHSYAVYLFENGRRNIELMRLLLISEACVVKHDSYLNRYSENLDLRRMLLEQVMPAYRDDPLVHWSAGVCHMNASQFSEAAAELRRSLELGLDLERFGIEKRDILLRIMLAAAMGSDARFTLEYVRDGQLGNDDLLWADYADMLARLGYYDECIELCRNRLRDDFPDGRVAEVMLRAMWWSGRHADYVEAFEYLDAVLLGAPQAVDAVHWDRLAWLRRQLLAGGLGEAVQTVPADEPWSRELSSVLAEELAVLGNTAGEAMLMQRAGLLQSGLEVEGLSWQQRNRMENELAWTLAQQARSAILIQDWEVAQVRLAEAEEVFAWPRPLALDSSGFLLAVANGGDAEELVTLLRGCITVAPFLLHSPEYAAACEAGKLDPDGLRRQIVHELARPAEPDCSYWSGNDNYSDWYNGEFDW